MDSFLSNDTDYPDWVLGDQPQGDASAAPFKTDADGFVDLDAMLAFPSPSFGGYHSSPESSGSSHGAPGNLDFNEVSWDGILNQPIFPQGHDEFSPGPSSHAHSSPDVPLMAIVGSPIIAAQSAAPTPAAVPAGGFPPFSASASPSSSSSSTTAPPTAALGNAAPANPELAKLLASMKQYNAQYGTLLPTGSTAAPTPAPHAPTPAPAPNPAPAPAPVARPSFSTSAAGSSSSSGSSSSQHGAPAESEDDDVLQPLRSFRSGSVVSNASAGAPPHMSAKALAKRVASGHLMSSVVVEDEDERGEGEEWRPTPEEYAKLDSKQKRQLRNKISAKNFRNRRKDYIDKLEGHLGERDRLLAFVQEEMRRKERENEELKREMAVLRNAVSMFNQTSFSVNGFAGATAPEPAADTSAFWTTNYTLNPTIQTVALPPLTKPEGQQQPNLNPLLQQIPSLKQLQAPPASAAAAGTFDQFADATPFSVRQATVDQYRSQLWARLAREAAYDGAADDKLALKPLFFHVPAAEAKAFGPSSRASAAGAGGIFGSLYPPAPAPAAPSASALIASHAAGERAQADHDSAHLALLATVTQQTIASKLSAAFLDAFVLPAPLAAPTSAAAAARALDADKMAAVVSGKARLEVVPVDAPAPAKRECPPTIALEKALAALSLSFGGSGVCRNTKATPAAAQPPKQTAGPQPKKLSWREYICPSNPVKA